MSATSSPAQSNFQTNYMMNRPTNNINTNVNKTKSLLEAQTKIDSGKETSTTAKNQNNSALSLTDWNSITELLDEVSILQVHRPEKVKTCIFHSKDMKDAFRDDSKVFSYFKRLDYLVRTTCEGNFKSTSDLLERLYMVKPGSIEGNVSSSPHDCTTKPSVFDRSAKEGASEHALNTGQPMQANALLNPKDDDELHNLRKKLQESEKQREQSEETRTVLEQRLAHFQERHQNAAIAANCLQQRVNLLEVERHHLTRLLRESANKLERWYALARQIHHSMETEYGVRNPALGHTPVHMPNPFPPRVGSTCSYQASRPSDLDRLRIGDGAPLRNVEARIGNMNRTAAADSGGATRISSSEQLHNEVAHFLSNYKISPTYEPKSNNKRPRSPPIIQNSKNEEEPITKRMHRQHSNERIASSSDQAIENDAI